MKDIKLPSIRRSGSKSLEQCIAERRSIRAFQPQPIEFDKVSQILWSAQGLTGPEGKRTAPSAGALYPIETYLAAGNVTGLPPAAYRYQPADHLLVPVREGDIREEIASAALGQDAVRQAAVVLCLAAVEKRITRKYGLRGLRYIDFEAGHIAQNACLQAVALDLGSVVVGAFEDENLSYVLRLSREEKPLYLVPIGVPFRGR